MLGGVHLAQHRESFRCSIECDNCNGDSKERHDQNWALYPLRLPRLPTSLFCMNSMDCGLHLPSGPSIKTEQQTVRMIADVIKRLSRRTTKGIRGDGLCRFSSEVTGVHLTVIRRHLAILNVCRNLRCHSGRIHLPFAIRNDSSAIYDAGNGFRGLF